MFHLANYVLKDEPEKWNQIIFSNTLKSKSKQQIKSKSKQQIKFVRENIDGIEKLF